MLANRIQVTEEGWTGFFALAGIGVSQGMIFAERIQETVKRNPNWPYDRSLFEAGLAAAPAITRGLTTCAAALLPLAFHRFANLPDLCALCIPILGGVLVLPGCLLFAAPACLGFAFAANRLSESSLKK